jgi:hypothetical protein
MTEPLSPELVLVSPPDLAGAARAALPPVVVWSPQSIASVAPSRERLPFAIFCALCALMTLAPLALIAAVH